MLNRRALGHRLDELEAQAHVVAQPMSGIAEHLRSAVADSPMSGIEVTASCGVAGCRGGAFDQVSILAAADRALYEATAQGRDRVATAGATPARVG